MSKPALPVLYSAHTEPEGGQYDARADQPLLHALEQGGSRWPSSCRNGTCRTCVGKLLRGSVRYEMEWPGLLAEEKAEGYVLPCVAFPCSDVVIQQGY